MAHPFEVRKEITVEASPERIWDAIATGPGLDAWFMGSSNTIEPRIGGRVVLDFHGESGESTVTAWEPPRHLGFRSPEGPDGSLHAFEYFVEAVKGGGTTVRLVHSGFLADDWEAEYDALNEGDLMYLHQMGQYVTWFLGRSSVPIAVWRPETRGREHAMRVFHDAIGAASAPALGDPVRSTLDGLPPIDGVVDFTSRSIVGVRTDDALYRFLYSPQGVVFLGHRFYREDVDHDATSASWQSWLDQSFA